MGPTQVQSPPSDQFPRGPAHIHDHHHPHEHHHRHHEGISTPSNAHYHHKEALRLALGSILNPKRPHTPSSRSSSGTASPAYPYSFPHTSTPGTPSIPPPAHPTPLQSHGNPSSLPNHPFPLPPPLQHSHSHTHAHGPSPLSLQNSEASHDHDRAHEHERNAPLDGHSATSDSQSNSPTHSSSLSKTASQCPSPHAQLPPALPEFNDLPVVAENSIVSPSPIQASAIPADAIVASDKAKVTYIQALQSKNRWDALIHGSFS